MAARFPGLTLGVLALAALSRPVPLPAQAEAAAAGERVVTADAIRRAGAFRLGDLLALPGDWDVLTVDEYTWRGAPPWSSPLEDDAWSVLVDGLPVEPGLLGVTSLGRLPLDLDLIDSVGFARYARLTAGTIADRGMVRVHTHRPSGGLTLRGRYATGAETGDPGPFEFVPPGPRNRDRFGHDATLGAAYGAPGWYVAGGLGLGTHVATDPAIVDRVAALRAGARIERTAPSVRLGVRAGGSTHALFLGRAALDDRFRLEAFGVEVPARSTLSYAGASGSVPAGTSDLRYRVTYQDDDLRSSAGAVEPRLELDRTIARAEVELALAAGPARGYVGLGASRRDLRTGYNLRDDPVTVTRAFGQIGWRLSHSLEQRVSVALEAGAGALGPGAVVEQDWRPSDRDVLSLALTAARPLREDDDGLYALTARGFAWLQEAGIPVAFEGNDQAPRAAAVHASWEHAIAQGLTIRLTGFYRAFRADYLARRELTFDPELAAWRGPVRLLSGRSGEAGGVELRAGGPISPLLAVELMHRHRRVLGGGEAVRDSWDRVPRHSSRLSVAYTPVPGLALQARLDHRGGTRWAEYTGRTTAPAGHVTVDLSIHKEFWARRLHAGLGLRNLFDAPLRFHPEGAALRRAAIFTLRTALPSNSDP